MKLTTAGAFCLALVLLSLLMTYPLVTDIVHTVPGPPGDNFEYVYKLWSFKHSVLDLNRSPFFIPIPARALASLHALSSHCLKV